MRKTLSVLFLVVALMLTTACASTGPPAEVGETLAAACDFYTDARPNVVAYRTWAIAHWDDQVTLEDGTATPLIPDRQKTLLLDLDEHLPKLDEVGRTICRFRDVAAMARASPGFDWSLFITTTLRFATVAAQLRADGAI